MGGHALSLDSRVIGITHLLGGHEMLFGLRLGSWAITGLSVVISEHLICCSTHGERRAARIVGVRAWHSLKHTHN